VIDDLRGGSFTAGFASGFFSAAATHGLGMDKWDNIGAGAAAAAVIGGTASVIGGGKFENGAMYGAFQYLYNAVGDKIDEERRAKEAAAELEKIKQLAQECYDKIKDKGAGDYQCAQFADDTAKFINDRIILKYWNVSTMRSKGVDIFGKDWFGHSFVVVIPYSCNPLSVDYAIDTMEDPGWKQYFRVSNVSELWKNRKLDFMLFQEYKKFFSDNQEFY